MFTKRNAALSREIKNLQETEADLLRKKASGTEANQAVMDIIPTAQHILDNYDILTTTEKNRLWKLVLEKATLYRTPAGELSVHIYPRLPKESFQMINSPSQFTLEGRSFLMAP